MKSKVNIFRINFRLRGWTAILFIGMMVVRPPVIHAEADYNIQVALNVAARKLEGQALLTWRNPSNRPVNRLCFHLYMNAFRNNQTYLLKRLGPRFYERYGPFTPERAGFVEFTHVVTAKGQLVDVRYDDDGTIAWLDLPESIPPGGQLQLQYSFETKLPVLILRTGYVGDFYMVGQWFPKIARMERGRWHCEPFYPFSEFYADFGTYFVSIQVPVRFVVGASGRLLDEHLQGEWKISRFIAERVHDFAWTAYPDYRLFEQEWRGHRIRIFYPPGHGSGARRIGETVQHALGWFAQHIGEYPYSVLTVVEPPIQGFRAGGMEYPTLIVTGFGLNWPKWLRMTDILAAHEFSHQYWYGVVATDETHHAWMDEGLATYSEIRLLDHRLGLGATRVPVLGTWGGYEELFQGRSMAYFKFDRPDQPSRAFQSFSSYVANTFVKPALVLRSLERIVGTKAMDRFLKRYYEAYRFRHPGPRDFFRLAEAVLGTRARRFLETYLLQPGVPDYLVRRVRCHPAERFVGYRDYAEERRFKEAEQPPRRYHCRVELRRYGGPPWPIPVRMTLTSGDTYQFVWKSKRPWFEWARDDLVAPLDRVEIDPSWTFLLDPNRANNGWVRRTPVQLRGAKYRLWMWLTQIYLSLLGLG